MDRAISVGVVPGLTVSTDPSGSVICISDIRGSYWLDTAHGSVQGLLRRKLSYLIHGAEFTSLRSLRQYAVLGRLPKMHNIYLVNELLGYALVKTR